VSDIEAARPSAKQTVSLQAYYAIKHATLDSLIKDSPFIVVGRVVDWKYQAQHDGGKYPDGQSPTDPIAGTVVTIEVTGVLAGPLAPGEKIEVYQMGGVVGATMFSFDEVPYLPDHTGEDLVLFLQTFDEPTTEKVAYRIAESHEGLWSLDSDRLSLLRGVEYTDKDDLRWNNADPASIQVPGAADFPVAMTLSELEKAIAEAK
jgi:hypothetical protein